MKQRIRELAEQAAKTGEDYLLDMLKNSPYDFFSAHQVEMEKFAELLIEEFLEIADSNLHPQAYAQVLAAVQQRFEIK